MKPVKKVQRYRCDHCAKVLTKYAMEKHENRCFFNPERFCDFCSNEGSVDEVLFGYGIINENCPYCEKYREVMQRIAQDDAEGLKLSDTAEKYLRKLAKK